MSAVIRCASWIPASYQQILGTITSGFGPLFPQYHTYVDTCELYSVHFVILLFNWYVQPVYKISHNVNMSINALRPRQNGRYFADDIFKCILLNENVWIAIKNSLKFVAKGPISNIPALVQIMAWCRQGDKPLSEPMMVSLTTHTCVARPQWVNTGLISHAIDLSISSSEMIYL